MTDDDYSVRSFGRGEPGLTFFVGVHGNERAPVAGFELLAARRDLTKVHRPFQVVISNQRALRAGQRCIDTDLNDAFPGNASGGHEARLAARLLRELPQTPHNFDFHSTSFACPPYGLISRLGDEVNTTMRGLPIQHYVFDQKKSLIRHVPVGIAFEVGQENDQQSAENAYQLMVDVLALFGVARDISPRPCVRRPSVHLIYDVLRLAHFESVDASIRDFARVERGRPIGVDKAGSVITAEETFVPVWVRHPEAIRMAKEIRICDWEDGHGDRSI